MASNNESLADGDGEYSDWVELHNPTTSAIDLSGWVLTDDDQELDRWTFPDLPQSVVGPGEYLVVFASGQATDDYVDAGGNLHTNFSLDADGEYLGLVDTSGVVVHEYSPDFPDQLVDVSYGISQSNTTLVGDSSPVRYLVPANGSLGATWTDRGFDDSSWVAADSVSVGYETVATGGTGELTNRAPDGFTSQSSVAFNGIPDNAIDGDFGNFTHTEAFTNFPSWWQVDLGETLVIEEVIVHNRDNCCTSRLRDITVEILDESDAVVFQSALLNPENVLGGPETLDLDLVALNGGAPIVGRTVRITRTPDFDLSGTNGQGNNDEFDVLSLGEVEVIARDQLSYEQVFQTDLESAMRNVNPGVYLRSTFSYDSAASVLDQLLLNMRYDDGFVAYLNGAKVAERNAPASPQHNSAATSEREDADAVVTEAIDLTADLGLLVDGDNVLAIHGLNLSAGDDDFLIAPELIGVSTTSETRYFDSPTPGEPNNEGLIGQVADTKFSVDRGFFDSAFQLEITSATPDAEIYYTTNGDEPTPSTGLLYQNPIEISATTVLRAAAFKDSYLPTNADTQTYLFLNDIVRQDYQATLDAGLPPSWGGTSPDYGFDTDVIGEFDEQGVSLGGDLFGGVYADTIKDDLQALPTISIVANVDELFGPDGIYTNSTRRGVAWERSASVELINPDGTDGFQVDAGLRIQGGAFRSHGLSLKHSFRLLFKNEYGPPKLNFPLFGEESATSEFNTIVLRAGANDGYTWDAARFTEQYTRDEFGRSLQRAIGSPSSHSTFAHLYVNGVYWGLYNPVERPDNEFAASYLTGDADNWDSIHVAETPAGDSAAWNAMLSQTAAAAGSLQEYFELQGKNVDGSPNPAVAPLLNVTSYADYIMLNVWGGNWDWPFKNFWAGRDRDPATTTGFEFFTWDFENTVGNNRNRSPLNATTLDQNFSGSRNAGQAHNNLRFNPEYRMLFADRIHRSFFNDGALTPDNLTARYQALANQVERGIVAESARWGDTKHSTPLTLSEWHDERDWILNTYLQQRSDIVMQEFRDFGLYPNTDAPVFNQHGGQLASGFELTMSAPNGTVYYTLDGSDPRSIGGALSPSAIEYTGQPISLTEAATVRARAMNGGEWSALNEAAFLVATPAAAENLRIAELHYNPAGPTASEEAAGYSDNDEFEFIELLNISADPIELSNVEFTDGVTYTFEGSTVLAPGERAVLVENPDAFETRYGTTPRVLGQWSGRLSNGGEIITLSDASGQVIQSFAYQDGDIIDEAAWSTLADGGGPSLVIVDTSGDYGSGANWRASSVTNGTPGEAEPAPGPGDFNGDAVVDQQDYQVWVSTFGSTTDLRADGNGDGVVDAADYSVWRDNEGAVAVANTSANAIRLSKETSEDEVGVLALSSDVAPVESITTEPELATSDAGRFVYFEVTTPTSYSTGSALPERQASRLIDASVIRDRALLDWDGSKASDENDAPSSLLDDDLDSHDDAALEEALADEIDWGVKLTPIDDGE